MQRKQDQNDTIDERDETRADAAVEGGLIVDPGVCCVCKRRNVVPVNGDIIVVVDGREECRSIREQSDSDYNGSSFGRQAYAHIE